MASGPRILLCTAHAAARHGAALPAAPGVIVVRARVTGPPDARRWARAVSELALFNWLLVPTREAAAALLAEAGAPPGGSVRLAAAGGAGAPFADAGRVPELGGDTLEALLAALAARLGRRERVLVPHAATAGITIGGRLAALGAEPVCVPAYGYAPAAGTAAAVRAARRLAALVARPDDAEVLRAALDRPPGEVRALALGAAAAAAAADCGFEAVDAAAGPLGPFLGEALS